MARARSLLPNLGLRGRVTVAFATGALILAVSAMAVVWGISRSYLIEVRQLGAVRQAQASAEAVDRLLQPQTPDLTTQARDLAGISGSGVLVMRGGEVLAAVGLAPDQLPPRLRHLVESGTAARQRVRLDGEVRLLVGVPLRNGAQFYQAMSFRQVDQALRALTVTLLASGVAGLVLAALWSRTAIRRALRPLDRFTAAARAVAAGELGTRLPEDQADLRSVSRLFNATTEALERRVTTDARFASTVSHELRTPLTTMTNAVALLEHRRGELSPVAQEAVSLLGGQVRRFERLVLDLLEISVATEGDRLSLEQVDIGEFLRRLAQAQGWPPPQVPDEPLVADVDPRRLERIVCNLVSNAEAHGGGLVRVGLRQDGGRARIEVDDAGPGVPPESRELVFERFFHRAARHGSATRGTGLGLALVAQLTALHGGSAWVDDRPGGGARFVVEFPAQPDEVNG